jgi:hypothetical protein
MTWDVMHEYALQCLRAPIPMARIVSYVHRYLRNNSRGQNGSVCRPLSGTCRKT